MSVPEPVKPKPDPEAAPKKVDTSSLFKRLKPTEDGEPLDPTRYGDWEMNGRCIDF